MSKRKKTLYLGRDELEIVGESGCMSRSYRRGDIQSVFLLLYFV